MLYALHCVDKPGSIELRNQLRPDHIAYLDGHRDKIVLAGATLTDDGETMTGSLIVINVDGRAEAAAFSAGDPFTAGGLFASVTITRMRKGFLSAAAAEGA